MNILYSRGVCYKGERDLLLDFIEYAAITLCYHLGLQSKLHVCHQFLNLIAVYFGFCEHYLGNFPEKVYQTVTYKIVTPYSPAEI
jgi:hypothetical protein